MSATTIVVPASLTKSELIEALVLLGEDPKELKSYPTKALARMLAMAQSEAAAKAEAAAAKSEAAAAKKAPKAPKVKGFDRSSLNAQLAIYFMGCLGQVAFSQKKGQAPTGWLVEEMGREKGATYSQSIGAMRALLDLLIDENALSPALMEQVKGE